jgi:hypothetical protein
VVSRKSFAGCRQSSDLKQAQTAGFLALLNILPINPTQKTTGVNKSSKNVCHVRRH